MSIRTTRSMFIATRKHFWCSAPSAFNSRFLLELWSDQVERSQHQPGACRSRKLSPRREASTTTEPTQHLYFYIAVKHATSPRHSESTVLLSRGLSSP